MKKTIGLTYDIKEDHRLQEGQPKDTYAEFDPKHVIDNVVTSLEQCGYKVIRIGNVHSLLKQVGNLPVDIVFNLAEGIGSRNRESQVPMILEMNGIPYIGSDALTLGLTLDKIIAKKIFISEGVPTPRFIELKSAEEIERNMDHLQFPLIVKLRYEGSSKGLDEGARVANIDELRNRVGKIVNTYNESVLVEEFIRGTEFTVGIIGNENPEALPIVQVQIDNKLDLQDMFYTFARISSDKLKYICPPKITDELYKKIEDCAIKAYKSVECRDFGRVDFRVDDKGNPYVLEINPLPSLSNEDTFMITARVLGMTFPEMLDKIITTGLKRYGIA
ncbi:MAG: ATP-grasp domain-containing protein [Candidatus Omnitrophica bacterium]|nr:ATP-grasp domain-containing protein [Candidatus Omnitrophota bacterium]HOX54679.1 ATP-grasp domain-containing protein [Candidatus Omnitrophota bacterium]